VKSTGSGLALLAGACLAVTPNVLSGQLTVNRMELLMRGTAGERDAIIGVRNETSTAVQAVVRLEDWDRSADGTNRWYAYGSRAGSCGRALSIFPLSVNLEPGASQSLRLTIDSAAVPPTECWAAAVIESVVEPRPDQHLTYVLRTAVKIYVDPPGMHAKGEISALRLVDADSETGGPSSSTKQIEFEFANTGLQHLASRGTVEFRRPDNSVAARMEVPTLYALPGARQVQHVSVPRLAPGRYVILLTLDYGGDDLVAAQIEYDVAPDAAERIPECAA
jgi:P pilus assembly chaperone PapD